MPLGQWGDDIDDYRHAIKSVFTEHLYPIKHAEISDALESLKIEIQDKEGLFNHTDAKDRFIELLEILIHNVKALGDKQDFLHYLLTDITDDFI